MSRVAIVGAGPAGGTAALWLSRAGLVPVLIDADSRPGGTGWSGSDGDALRRDLSGSEIDYRAGSELVDFDRHGRLTLQDGDGRLDRLHPEIVIAAPGAVERHLPVPGWTLPGVFSLGALQLLNKRDRLHPAGPVALVGSGPLLRLVAAELIAAGTSLSVVIDAAPPPGVAMLAGLAARPSALLRGVGIEARRKLARVPLVHGWPRLLGGDRVEAVEVNNRRFDAETVGLGFGLVPDTELARLAGAAIDWDAGTRAWIVRRNQDLESTRRNLFCIGDGATVGGADLAAAEGGLVAAAVLDRIGITPPRALREQVGALRRRLARWRRAGRAIATWSAVVLPEGLADDTIVCRCEGTSVGDIRAAFAAGYRGAGPLKLACRAGMGRCQGRMCGSAVQTLAAEAGFLLPPGRVRPPLRPLSASSFAQMDG